MTSDADLLRQYLRAGSQAAFAELVRRHVGLVFATASRRLGGDVQLAEDVTQRVFTRLAQKAPYLLPRATLAGWLYKSAGYFAIDLVRAEHRRHLRETEAMKETELSQPAELDWRQLQPVIDELLGQLPSTARSAVLLRYFEGRSYPEVAAELGLSEPACRKRVGRALEQLRLRLRRRGIVSTTVAVEAVLSASAAVTGASAGLASQVAAAALSAPVIPGVALALFALMNTTKVAVGVLIAAIVLSAGLEWAEFAHERSVRRTLASLNRENAALRQRQPVAPAAALNSSVVRAPEAGAKKGSKTKSLTPAAAAGRKFLADHPEAQKLLLAARRSRPPLDYAGLYQKLNLTPAQIAQFEDILVQENTHMARLWSSPEGTLALPLQGPLSLDEAAQQIQTLLGPDGYASYQTAHESHDTQGLVAQFAGAIAQIDPLNAAQADRLVEIIKGSASGGSVDWTAVVAGAQGVLSPSQLDLLGGMSQQIQFNRAQDQLNRAAAAHE